MAGIALVGQVWADEEKEEDSGGWKRRVAELEAAVAILQGQVLALQGQAHARYTGGGGRR